MTEEPAAPEGPGYLCLDATPLIHFSNHDQLDVLGELCGSPAFTPTYVLEEEIRVPMRGSPKYRKNSAILKAQWLVGAELPDLEGAERVAALKRRLGGSPRANLGECHVLALCERHGWTAIVEDEDARLAANDPDDGPLVPTIYMVTLLAVGAGFSRIDPRAAWRIHREIETPRRGSILLPEHEQVFKNCVEVFRKLEGKVEPWPQVLARGATLDAVIVHERRRA